MEKSKYWKYTKFEELEKLYNPIDFSTFNWKPSIITTKKEEIIYEVCKVYEIQESTIFQKSRKRTIVEPRQMVMFLLRHDLDMPFSKIARLFRCHHATVIHAVRIMKVLIGMDYDVWEKYCKLNVQKPHINPINPIIKDEIGKRKKRDEKRD